MIKKINSLKLIVCASTSIYICIYHNQLTIKASASYIKITRDFFSKQSTWLYYILNLWEWLQTYIYE